ncbi:MAG: 23S rRNA (adenine(2503)-C(2))-methyltransferase RlmN [Deltaproteobacteria bacterium]|nr:23S rRNA (adenine(2503)-C(2))-methyltransferase RlmN [Deltaproteobacteria bacterium]
MTKVDLKGLDARETEAWAVEEGLEPYRGRQVRHWLFQKLVLSPDEMTNIPKSLRALLAEKASLVHLKMIKNQVSQDGTQKYLFQLLDGHFIESVLIPERDHSTLCISSQAGCAMGCFFCLTGQHGLKRNLSPAEIVDQAVLVKRSMEGPDRLTNIVLMGMGEPLANYDNVVRAVGNLIAEDGMNFSHRKITLSTCGLVPEIKKLGQDITVNLAISLNGADDKTRNFLMPINRKYPLKTLIAACREFPLPNRRMITFEYILIAGVNDRDKDARNLANLLSGLRAKINLIPLNQLPGLNMVPPSLDDIYRFQEILIKRQFTAIIRKSKGQDIAAACGQLSGGASEL